MTNRATPLSYRRMYIDTIKKHLFFLMAGVALLDLREVKFKLVIRGMGIMTHYACPGLDRSMDIRLSKICGLMAGIT